MHLNRSLKEKSIFNIEIVWLIVIVQFVSGQDFKIDSQLRILTNGNKKSSANRRRFAFLTLSIRDVTGNYIFLRCIESRAGRHGWTTSAFFFNSAEIWVKFEFFFTLRRTSIFQFFLWEFHKSSSLWITDFFLRINVFKRFSSLQTVTRGSRSVRVCQKKVQSKRFRDPHWPVANRFVPRTDRVAMFSILGKKSFDLN